ncbi:MAG: adenylate/guanylate cyclase domain-containing protein [Treponema sp.]|jgi:class 3 adenylate cyclase|nr:adenylate/guanylate cyclase domain-containing protein [Treponema sp.]
MNKNVKCAVLLLVLTSVQVFAQNHYTGSRSTRLDGFLLHIGNKSEMGEMAASEFDMPGFEPYDGGDLPAPVEGGENYYVFKTKFSISENYRNRDITLYIDPLYVPFTVRVNNIVIYQGGIHSDGVYSTGTPLAVHVPLAAGLINYSQDNVLVIETFPQYETNRLSEFSIADYNFNEKKVFMKNLLTSHLVLAAQILSLLIACYHFFLFLSRGRKDIKYVYFTFLCLSFFFAYSSVGFAFNSPHYTLLLKVTRIFQLLTFAFFAAFMLESVGIFEKKKKYIIAGLLSYSFLCALFIAFQKTKQAVNAMYAVMTNYNTIPILAGSIIILAYIVFFRKNKKVVQMFIVVLTVAGASLRDLLILKTGIEPMFWAAPYSFLLMVIIIFAMLIIEENFLQSAFSRYLAPEIISEIVKNPDKLNLGGEKREMTVIFTDIRNFSAISEQLDPVHLVRLLNRYLTVMSNIIMEYLGTIDKYWGDAIIAFFGAPLFNAEHPALACRSALAIKAAEKELNKTLLNEGLISVPIFTRIGINTGEMVIGNMGAEKKMDYTVMGNAVNLASRIEGVNKQYHTGGILISEYTRAKIGDEFLLRRLDRVRVVGIQKPLRLYELLSANSEVTDIEQKAVKIWESAIDLYERRKFSEALRLFSMLMKRFPEDNVAKLYTKRCITFVKTPPPHDWDEVNNLMMK